MKFLGFACPGTVKTKLKEINKLNLFFLITVLFFKAKLYNLDNGIYDISPIENIYYISKRFTQLPMLALDAKLAC